MVRNMETLITRKIILFIARYVRLILMTLLATRTLRIPKMISMSSIRKHRSKSYSSSMRCSSSLLHKNKRKSKSQNYRNKSKRYIKKNKGYRNMKFRIIDKIHSSRQLRITATKSTI